MRYVAILLAQTAGVIFLAVSGALVGRRFWRVKNRVWIAAYVASMSVAAAIVVPRWVPRAELMVPFKWIVAGRREFAVMAFVCPLLLTTPLSRLPQRRNRRAVAVLMVLLTGYYSVLPFVAPAIEYPRLAALETTLDTDGVCLQSTQFNCGPASAVTVLRSLGVSAEEGAMAIRSHTTRFVGAPMDSLCNAMRGYGVPARLVHCRAVGELQGKGPFVAVIKFHPLFDHYVAVLSVTEREVTIGDPLEGLRTCTPEEFDKKWRRCAIIIDERDSNTNRPGE